MPVNPPTLSDPEIASVTFREHLESLWATARPIQLGWGRVDLDSLTTVVALPGERATGEREWYFVRLGALYYDAGPPTAAFVDPKDWSDSTAPSRWYPQLDNLPNWFGLHSNYSFPGGITGQLICCSMTAQFYFTDHSPKATEIWQQGKHTVAATLSRIAEILGPSHYRGPTT